MPSAFAEELAAAWPDLADAFGERQPIIYAQPGQAPRAIRAILDRPPETVNPGDELSVITSRPTLSVCLADLAQAPAEGDAATISAGSAANAWTVLEVLPDGQGFARLHLHKR